MVKKTRVPCHVTYGIELGFIRVVSNSAALYAIKSASFLTNSASPSGAIVLVVAVSEVREHRKLTKRSDAVLTNWGHLQLGARRHLRRSHLSAVGDTVADLPRARSLLFFLSCGISQPFLGSIATVTV